MLSGSAKAQSVPLNNEYRTFGIALKVKYDGESDYSEEHYQAFNAYTDSMQNVTLSVAPYDSEKTVEKVAFAFVYGYNKNKMEVKNAMLNYAYNGTDEEPSTEPETAEPSSTEPETTSPAASEPENEDILIDEEIQSESINTDEEYMRSQKSYDSNGNYVTSEVDEAGNTTSYENDADGNVTKITDGNHHSTSYTYDVHNNLKSVSVDLGGQTASNSYTYNAYNELSKITHNGFDYNYTYSNFGEPASVKVGSQALITYEYNSNGNVTKATYGNGDYLDYTYDDYARITKVKLNNTSTLATYVYNKKNQVTKFTDGKSGETTEYSYDCNGNALYKYLISSDGDLLRVVDGETEKTKINGSERTITNGTDENGKSYVQNGNAKITSESDDFGRTTEIKTSIKDEDDFVEKFNLSYTYKNVGETHQTTNSVDEMTYKLGNDTEVAKYKYSYDGNGNITCVESDGVLIAKYQYDRLNQIKVAWDYQQNLKFTYTYDNSGNISGATNQALDPRYGEDYTVGSPHSIDYYYNDSSWGDLLTSINSTPLTYDAIGNPTSYRDGMTMSWTGRELQSITKNSNTYNFTYNLDGLRTKREKKQGDTVLEAVNYYYDDSNNLIGLKKGTTTVLFYYDSEGKVYSMTKGDDTYFFIKNLQGDVTKIIDENGNTCATYAYDAWGTLLAENEDSSVEGLNPFRYRGYVYDSETEFYYLQSRYYDPKTGRFINADSPEYTDTYSGSPLSTNMFAYCENNAISGYDPNGNWDLTDHRSLCLQKEHKFSKITWSWDMLADIIFFSDEHYSSPFHSRDNLNKAHFFYNVAIDLKKSTNKSNKLATICISTGKNPKEGFNSDKTKYYIPSKYISYQNKDTGKLEPNGEKTQILLKYLNGGSFSQEDKIKISEIIRKRNLSYTIASKINNRKEQSEAFLGLSLHAFQDYFAHKITVTAKGSTDKYNGKKNIIYEYGFMTSVNNVILHKHTLLMEDNKNVMPWRWDATKDGTKTIYELYSKKKRIKSIYSIDTPEIYTSELLNYNGKRGKGYKGRYWYLTAHRVVVQIN